MEMSKAAIAPTQPPIKLADRRHPLFPIYQLYRASMSNQLVEAASFRDWLSCYERELSDRESSRHPKYSEFLNWMQTNQGGARPCPAGIFPHNFRYWLEGGRW